MFWQSPPHGKFRSVPIFEKGKIFFANIRLLAFMTEYFRTLQVYSCTQKSKSAIFWKDINILLSTFHLPYIVHLISIR